MDFQPYFQLKRDIQPYFQLKRDFQPYFQLKRNIQLYFQRKRCYPPNFQQNRGATNPIFNQIELSTTFSTTVNSFTQPNFQPKLDDKGSIQYTT